MLYALRCRHYARRRIHALTLFSRVLPILRRIVAMSHDAMPWLAPDITRHAIAIFATRCRRSAMMPICHAIDAALPLRAAAPLFAIHM